MTPLRPLIILAIVANVLTILFYKSSAAEPGGTGASLAFVLVWMPLIWITTFVIALIITIKKRKQLFGSKSLLTIFILLFCTPVPLVLGFWSTDKEEGILLTNTSFRPINGKIYKTQTYSYRSGKRLKYVDMYFVADSTEEKLQGNNAYKHDSVWVYFTEKGDTLKVEKYDLGRLLESKDYKKE